MLTCLSPNGSAETHSSTAALHLLVGTICGVYKFERDKVDAPWKLKFSAINDKQISSLLYEPNSKLLFAGVHGNGGQGEPVRIVGIWSAASDLGRPRHRAVPGHPEQDARHAIACRHAAIDGQRSADSRSTSGAWAVTHFRMVDARR